MQTVLQLDRKSQQPEHTVEKQLARQQICRSGACRSRAKRKQCCAVTRTQKIKHPTGMCKWDVTHKAGGKPLQSPPTWGSEYSRHRRVSWGQGSKGKRCTRSRKHNPQGKAELDGASQYRQRWLNRETRMVVFKLMQKVLFQGERD